MSFRTSVRRGMLLGLLILPIAFVTLQVTETVTISPPRYSYTQPYYVDDVRIGRWLAVNGTSVSAVTVNDADIDPTATWIQPYSMYQHVIYKVAYANIAAPQAYVQIYRDTTSLYVDPVNATAYQIITRYNIQYVVAHSNEIPVFESSQHFKPVLLTGDSALFQTTGM